MKRVSRREYEYVAQVLDNGFASSTNTMFTTRLEKAFSAKFASQYAISCCNGTATMHAALAALGVGAGDEVIVPPLTMSSPALSVLHNGSIPVFADVDPDTFIMTGDSVEAVATSKTKAVIVVSLYGLPPDYDALVKACQKRNIALIEDNAQCFLATYKGRLAGNYGDFASYSFQASKHMTCGEGGMLTCNDRKLADEARRFCSLGYGTIGADTAKIDKRDILSPDFPRHVCLGFNYRMSDLQAAAALGQLEHLEELVEARVRAARQLADAVQDFSWFKPQAEPEGTVNSFWTFAGILDLENSARWRDFFDIHVGLGGDAFYGAWLLSYQEPLFQSRVQHMDGVWQDYDKGLCPRAEYAQRRMMQFKTNYWEDGEAARQAAILHTTCKTFEERYGG